jgi:hypothetical protein
MNVWIPVPTEAETWRVDLEVRPYERGKVAQALGRFCRAVGVRDIFYPEAKSIKSQAFEK